MTNADKIRNMTDEELDEFLAMWECGDIDYAVTFCDLCEKDGNILRLDCDGCRMHWLKSDVIDENQCTMMPSNAQQMRSKEGETL